MTPGPAAPDEQAQRSEDPVTSAVDPDEPQFIASLPVRPDLKYSALRSDIVDNLPFEQLHNVARELKTQIRCVVKVLEQANSPEVLDALIRLKHLSVRRLVPKTTIAVLGETRVGKSTLINALVGEEALTPMSGDKVCTAVPIEFIYNASRSRPFRAEIEFKSAAETKQLVETLLDDLLRYRNIPEDLLDDQDISELNDANGQLQALCPDANIHSILDTLSEAEVPDKARELMSGEKFRYINKTLRTWAKSRDDFYKKTRDFMDQTGGYWLLIKSVQIYTRSKTLSTGAVLVDLPGLRDGNMARTERALEYEKKATCLWICSAMEKAVHFTPRSEVLGRSLRYQVRMDGKVDNITLIVTKSDIARDHILRDQPDMQHHMQTQLQPLFAELSRLKSERKTVQTRHPESQLSLQLRVEIDATEDKIHATCINLSNDRCKKQMRECVAAELAGRRADQRRPRSGNGFPVYTVSAESFLQMKWDRRANGPTREDATEIPQLREHCISEGLSGSIPALKDFANEAFEELNDLGQWAIIGRDGRVSVAPVQLEQEKLKRRDEHLSLLTDARELVASAISKIKAKIETVAYPAFDTFITRMETQLPLIVDRWGSRYRWNTYQVVCRKLGKWEHRKSAPTIDWRVDLTAPMQNAVCDQWQQVLSDHTADVFVELAAKVKELLEGFHERFELRNKVIASDENLQELNQRLRGLDSVRRSSLNARALIQKEQADITRLIDDQIMAVMTDCWRLNGQEQGAGMFNKMKQRTSRYTADAKIYKEIKTLIKVRIDSLLKQVESETSHQLEGALGQVCNNYEGVGIGLIGRTQRENRLRDKVLEALKRINPELERAKYADPKKYADDADTIEDKAAANGITFVDLEGDEELGGLSDNSENAEDEADYYSSSDPDDDDEESWL